MGLLEETGSKGREESCLGARGEMDRDPQKGVGTEASLVRLGVTGNSDGDRHRSSEWALRWTL